MLVTMVPLCLLLLVFAAGNLHSNPVSLHSARRTHHRTHYLHCPIRYYSNSSATFNIHILSHGDIQPHPGPSNHETHNRQTLKQVSGITFNARSLRNKMEEVESFLQSTSYDIINVTETWLTQQDTVNAGFDGYQIFRRDRPSGRGGGVLAAIIPELSPKRRADLEKDDIEMLCVDIASRFHVKWLLCILYRPPNAPADFWDHLQTAVDDLQVASADYHGIILTGDFNVNWAHQQLPIVQHLERITSSMDLSQMVDDVTRRSPDNPRTGTIIDLLFTNRPHLVLDVCTQANPVTSDHHAICFKVKLKKMSPPKQILRDYLQYNKADTEHFNNILYYAPWDLFMDTDNIDNSWDGFMDIFDAAVRDCIPRKKSRNNRLSPWITLDIKKMISKKNRMFKISKQLNTNDSWQAYRELRNQVKVLINKSYYSYLNELLSDSDDNRKRFFAFVRSKRKNRAPLSIDNNGLPEHEPSKIAQVFANYFSTMFTPNSTCNDIPEPRSEHSAFVPYLQNVNISTCDVSKVIRNLRNDKSPGPDNITPNLLKMCSVPISPVLCKLFNISLSLGQLPMSWKQANVSPIHKAGDSSLPSNYRPIALTSVVCKIIEKVITNEIQHHTTEYCLLNPNQHGFVKGKSCVTQLLNVTNRWLRILDVPSPPKIDAIFLDFQKAFDLMPHDVLLQKLNSRYFISGSLWQWIRSFLCNREQRVIHRGALSSWFPVLSGVPQGSVLGPTLFNLFIDDILTQTISPCVLFADDTLVYRPISNVQDMHILQNDLDKLNEWCIINKMRINEKKTKVMRITCSRQPGIPNYTLNNTLLQSVTEFRYLGIMLNNKLTWHNHVEYITRKANRMLGFVLSVTRSLAPHTIFSIFKSLVIPILEYGQPVWHLHTKLLSNKIETIQRRATRVALRQRRQQMSYENRLQLLNWQSLESRRKYCLISYVVKSLFRVIECGTVGRAILVNARRTDEVRFVHLRARTQRMHGSAINAFPRYWDELPESLRTGVVETSLSTWLAALGCHLRQCGI